jgi:hypothetical protein
MRCRIDSDSWEDAGKTYFVHYFATRPNSTGVAVKLEDDEGNIIERVVASHQIVWVSE